MKSFVYLLAAVLVGMLFLGAASPTFATGHGQQAVIVQQYAVPQAVIVPYVQQQQAACVVQQFNAYSVPLVQQHVARQQVFVPQRVVQKEFINVHQQNFRSVQRLNVGGGRQRSVSIQSSSSGRRGFGIF